MGWVGFNALGNWDEGEAVVCVDGERYSCVWVSPGYLLDTLMNGEWKEALFAVVK